MNPTESYEFDVIIVGAGLSGIQSASILLASQKNLRICIIEASKKIGGRLLTINGVDLGGMWTWPGHDTEVNRLIKLLKVESREHLGSGQNRFVGGAERLVQKLYRAISDRVTLFLNEPVSEVRHNSAELGQEVKQVQVFTKNNKFLVSKNVIIAVPPKVVLRDITFSPVLPHALKKAMDNTPTWMAGASKAVFNFKSPFWLSQKFQPMYLKNDLILYDLVDDINERYSLIAFNGGAPSRFTINDMQNLVFPHIVNKYGKIVVYNEYINAHIHNWLESPSICANSQEIISNGRSSFGDAYSFGNPILRSKHYSNIFFASTETENESGHIEGALLAARRCANEILQMTKPTQKT